MDNVIIPQVTQVNLLPEIKQSNTYNQLVTQDNRSLDFKQTFNLAQTFNEFNSLTQTVNNFNITVNETFNNLIDKTEKTDLTSKFIKGFDSLVNKVKAFGGTVSSIIDPGVSFEQSIADISASSGIAGDDLDKVSRAARQTGKESGVGASETAGAFGILASALPVDSVGVDGLIELQKNSVTLSQAAGITMNESATALAATISSFGIEAGEAGRVINVMAASSKYGSTGINELAESLKTAGAQSATAGVSLEETAGALEILSQNNIKGAEAGTQLSGIIEGLQSVFGAELGNMSLTQALDQLKPKMEDAAFISQVFGSESAEAAKSLIQNASAVGEMADKITDTDTAFEQAAVRTDTTAQMMERCRSKIDDLKIGFFELTGDFGGYMSVIGEYAGAISDIMPLFTSLGEAITFVTDAEKMQSLWADICKGATMLWNGVQMIFNATLWANPITWVVIGIVALVAAIIFCCTQVEGWGKQWKSIVNFMKLSGELFVESFKFQFESMINKIMIGIDKLKIGWYKFKNAVGLGDSDENDKMIAGLDNDIANREKEMIDGQKRIDDLKKVRNESFTWDLTIKKSKTDDKGENGNSDKTTDTSTTNTNNTVNSNSVTTGILPELGFFNNITNATQTPTVATAPPSFPVITKGSPQPAKNISSGKSVLSTESGENREQKEAAPNLKGSTNYTAIVAGITPFKSNALLESTKVTPENAGTFTVSNVRESAVKEANPVTSEIQKSSFFEKILQISKSTLAIKPFENVTNSSYSDPVFQNKGKGIFNTQFLGGNIQNLLGGNEVSPANKDFTNSTNDINNINDESSLNYLTSKTAKPLSQTVSFFKAASIATAAMLLPATTAATTSPVLGESATTAQTELYSEDNSYQGISMNKFCDTIEIHIANADDKGYRQIEEEVCQTLMKVFDNYGA